VSTPARPRLLFSRCLGFERCRYNGEVINDEFVAKLVGLVDTVTVCPETAIGLGVPRDPIRIVRVADQKQLVQPATGREFSREMTEFTEEFLDALGPVDGFVLKSRSPSCGTRDVKTYNAEGNLLPSAVRQGFFGGAVMNRHTALPVEDEGRLRNFTIREHFLARVWAMAEFRRLAQEPSMGGLVAFHARHKLLLMAYNQDELHRLGRVVANAEKRPVENVFGLYAEGLGRAMAHPAKYTAAINVLMHALGYFKDGLNKAEKADFLDQLEGFRRGKLPLSVPVGLLRSWIARFGEEYLAQQSFLQPYPVELVEISDSGKGR
jgi:uncharacterized protein YbgA (DUF1722 family)/uncharacterized protein YbbK (DUF523 family)